MCSDDVLYRESDEIYSMMYVVIVSSCGIDYVKRGRAWIWGLLEKKPVL